MSDEREMTLREYIDSKPLHEGHLIVRQLAKYEQQVEQLKKENEALIEAMDYLNSLLKSYPDIAQMGDSQDKRILTQAKKVLTQAMKFTTNN